MSRHHILPPIAYTPPPPPKKPNRKRRVGVGELDDTEEVPLNREATGPGGSAAAGKPAPQTFPAIEASERKPKNPAGRLSEGTLAAMLQAQEFGEE